ncbi:hypothetical protein D3C79_795770 [compost metagenome]
MRGGCVDADRLQLQAGVALAWQHDIAGAGLVQLQATATEQLVQPVFQRAATGQPWAVQAAHGLRREGQGDPGTFSEGAQRLPQGACRDARRGRCGGQRTAGVQGQRKVHGT